MQSDKYQSSLVPGTASANEPFKIDLIGNINSISIKNTLESDNKLWVGINTTDMIEPLLPGEEINLPASEGSKLEGFVIIRWDAAAVDKYGVIKKRFFSEVSQEENCQ